MSSSTIALTLYTLRQFTQNATDIAQTLHRVKKIGYDYVQFSAMGAVEPKELRKMLDGEGLGVCSTHVSYTTLRDSFDRMVEDHRVWGATHVALASLPQEMRNYEGYIRYAKEGSEFAKKLATLGVTLSYHNHSFELEKHNGRRGLDILYEDGDPALFLGEIDTYWIQHGGGDPAAWIARLKSRQPLVHFKDMVIYDGKQTMTEVGEGNLNWPAIIDACHTAGVQWHIVEQDVCQRDPFESVAISLRNLKALGLK